MDPELFKHLRETVDDNNRLLHELIRAKRWGNFLAILKWLAVIGAALGAYYYFQPLIDQTLGVYNQVINSADKIFNPLNNLSL